MQARDIMTSPAICVAEDATVADVARRLLAHRISAVPVTDAEGRLVGIVSEGDLVRRVELGTARPLSWWRALLAADDAQARAYAKSHGRRAAEVMTRDVITVAEDTELPRITALLERHRIKRVPVVRDGSVVGIVSRADLLNALLARPAPAPASEATGWALRDRIVAELERAGVHTAYVHVVVDAHAVHLRGLMPSRQQRETARIAAESVAGSIPVISHLIEPPERLRAAMAGGE